MEGMTEGHLQGQQLTEITMFTNTTLNKINAEHKHIFVNKYIFRL